VSVLDAAAAERLGLWHSYQFVTFEGRLPDPSPTDRLVTAARRAVSRVR
jgi:hypothetical protein